MQVFFQKYWKVKEQTNNDKVYGLELDKIQASPKQAPKIQLKPKININKSQVQ